MNFTFYDWLIENKEVMGVGPGLWCPLHITLIVLLAAWLVAFWFIAAKHKNFALKLTTVLCWIMIFSRLFRMGLLFFSGKQSFVEVLPWHLCHLMSFVFPLFYLTKTKKFFLAILVVTFFGGILTFLFGDYYYLSTLSFLHYESLFLHFAMPTVVIACLATGYFKVKVKDFWQPVLGIFLIAGWSMIGNLLVKDANFLYLMKNGLPFNFTITPFYVYDKIKKKKEDKSFSIIWNVLTNPL